MSKFLKNINRITSKAIIFALILSLLPINAVSLAQASEPVFVKEMQTTGGEAYTVGKSFVESGEEHQITIDENGNSVVIIEQPDGTTIEVPVDKSGNPIYDNPYIPTDDSGRVINNPFESVNIGLYDPVEICPTQQKINCIPTIGKNIVPIETVIINGKTSQKVLYNGEVYYIDTKAPVDNEASYEESKGWFGNKINSVKQWANTKEGTGYMQVGLGLLETIGGVAQIVEGTAIATGGTVFGVGVGGVIAVPIGVVVGASGVADTVSGISRIKTGFSNIFSNDSEAKKAKGNFITNIISTIDNGYIRLTLNTVHLASGLISTKNIFKNIPKLYNGAKTKIKTVYNATKGLYDDIIRNSDDIGGVIGKISGIGKGALIKTWNSTKNIFNNIKNWSWKKNPNIKTWQETGMNPSDAIRIQNAADKINKPINVVGSRASGDYTTISDWDYVVEGLNSKTRGKIKNSLPIGTEGGELIGTSWSGIDINPVGDKVDQLLPHIEFNPGSKVIIGSGNDLISEKSIFSKFKNNIIKWFK